jgi:hypothetical protein
MPKLRVTIIETRVATFDSGDIPANLIRELLLANEGSFDGKWGLDDVSRNEKYTIDSITVEPIETGIK